MRRSPIIPRLPKPRPYDDPAYLRWIRTLPCSVEHCRARRSEAHHAGTRGLGQTAPDRTAIPLCPEHHFAYHRVFGKRFWPHFRIDRDALIMKLNEQYEVFLLGGKGRKPVVSFPCTPSILFEKRRRP